MTKIQIGWKAKDGDKRWYIYRLDYKPDIITRLGLWDNGNKSWLIPDHP